MHAQITVAYFLPVKYHELRLGSSWQVYRIYEEPKKSTLASTCELGILVIALTLQGQPAEVLIVVVWFDLCHTVGCIVHTFQKLRAIH